MSDAALRQPPPALDVAAVREDFPILHQEVNGHPLAYLDNAASSQRPRQVLEAIDHYYRHDHANVHRGVHTLSQRATDAYEGARAVIAESLNAASDRELIFLRGTTEAINLVAQSFARPRLGPGDEILVSWLEHHSNIVPWQLVCEQTGATLKAAPINADGEIIVEAFEEMLGPRTRMVALNHVSNALGTVNPVETLIPMARAHGIPVLLDGAQALPHQTVDVQALGCDFYAFSGHKMFGPTGIGGLWGRESLLDEMPPWQGGGEMIRTVTFEGSDWAELPSKFEAGTPNIAGAVGLGAAFRYIASVGMDRISAWEAELLAYATEALQTVEGLRIIGTARRKASVVSFVMDDIHPHDIGTIVDSCGVAIRTGHHCAQPVMAFFGVPATARASFAFYNTREEIDQLVAALERTREMFA
jgi:cysteine desulfurase/selenocysteine lyase